MVGDLRCRPLWRARCDQGGCGHRRGHRGTCGGRADGDRGDGDVRAGQGPCGAPDPPRRHRTHCHTDQGESGIGPLGDRSFRALAVIQRLVVRIALVGSYTFPVGKVIDTSVSGTIVAGVIKPVSKAGP